LAVLASRYAATDPTDQNLPNSAFHSRPVRAPDGPVLAQVAAVACLRWAGAGRSLDPEGSAPRPRSRPGADGL